MSLVDRIKALCRQHETSIPKLEANLGLSRGSMYKWDINDPGIGKVQKVAEHFNVSIEFLLYGLEPKPKPFNKQTLLRLAKDNNLTVGQVVKVLDEAKSAILNETVV